MEPRISVLVVNLNNLEFTKNCLQDLSNQDIPFNLRIVDQNSEEEGTGEFLQNFFDDHILKGKFHGRINFLEILNSGSNRPLNHLWNEFVEWSSTPFCCILNNDVRIAPNFLSSALKVFEIESQVGFVNHTTNKRKFSKCDDTLEYVVIEEPYRQGWDFIFRKESYTKIPEELKFFYGDDFIYSKLYENGFKGAYVLNSPMIHYERSTTVEKKGQRDLSLDAENFFKLNLKFRELEFCSEFSSRKPEFFSIEMRNKYSKENYITRDANIEKWESHLNSLILSQYKNLLTGQVADFGCNRGSCTIIAGRSELAKNIKGIDLNKESIKIANEILESSQERQHVKEKIRFSVGNLTNLNRIRDDEFDSAFCFHTLEHIYPEDYNLVFGEWKRVIKNGGYLIVSVPYLDAYDDPCHVNYFDEISLEKLFTESGFIVHECYRDQRNNFDCLNIVLQIEKKEIDLTIIICSLVERNTNHLQRLLKVLEPQVENLNNVEILILTDNAKRSIGKKRNDGLNLAQGKYVCFIDDDDLISSDYVQEILFQISLWKPDVVVFDAIISFNGENHKLVKYGREFDHTEDNVAYFRRPNHLMVHKKSNITEFFKDVKTGEDDEWASRMLDRIVTQSRIQKVLYYYDYRTTTKKYFE